MPDYYAQSLIRTGEGNIQPGDKVTAASKGLSKEDFEQLVESGAVSEDKYEETEVSGVVGAAATVEELDEGTDNPTRSGS